MVCWPETPGHSARDAIHPAGCEPAVRDLSSLQDTTVEPDGEVFDRPKHARACISKLRARRQRSHLHEPKTHIKQWSSDTRVFVEAGRNANRVGEVEAKKSLA